MAEIVQDLPIDQVYPHPMGNVRGQIPPAQIEEMALSIQLFKQIIQPLIVFTYEDGWGTIEGHVRREGAKLLLVTERWPERMPKTLPGIVRDGMSFEQHRAIMLATASVRYELNPVDEGLGYKRLMAEKELKTAHQVADYCGVKENRVISRLNIVSLAEPVIQLFRERKLQLGAADHLVKLRDPRTQTDLALTLVELGDIHLDAIGEAVNRVMGGGPVPRATKKGFIKIITTKKIEPANWPAPNGHAPAALPAAGSRQRAVSTNGGDTTSAPIELYEGGALGLAEIQAGVAEVCRTCAARRKLPAKVSWAAAEGKWLAVCDNCEAIKRISTACNTCPLAKFLDKLLGEENPERKE